MRDAGLEPTGSNPWPRERRCFRAGLDRGAGQGAADALL